MTSNGPGPVRGGGAVVENLVGSQVARASCIAAVPTPPAAPRTGTRETRHLHSLAADAHALACPARRRKVPPTTVRLLRVTTSPALVAGRWRFSPVVAVR